MHQIVRRRLLQHSPRFIQYQLQSTLSSPIIPFYDKPQKHNFPVNKHKQRSSSQLLFGVHPVLLGLKACKRDVYKVFIKDIFWWADRNELRQRNFPLASILDIVDLRKIKKEIVGVRVLGALCNDRPHQGVVLECSPLPSPLLTNDIVQTVRLSPAAGISLFLDEVKDVMNFAGILRSAAFFSTTSVFIPASSSCTPHPIVSKISSGAMETINFFRVSDKMTAIKQLRDNGFILIGTAGQATDNAITVDELYTAPWLREPSAGPIVVVIGSEDVGVSQDILSMCHHILRIPGVNRTQEGLDISSLNVSVATGIILHALYSNINKTV